MQGEPSFEDDILRRTPCAVHTFDPTLDDTKRENLKRYPGIVVHEVGISNETKREIIADIDVEVQTLQHIMGKFTNGPVSSSGIRSDRSSPELLVQIVIKGFFYNSAHDK